MVCRNCSNPPVEHESDGRCKWKISEKDGCEFISSELIEIDVELHKHPNTAPVKYSWLKKDDE